MPTDALREAVKRYDAKNTRQFHLKLNKNTDAAIIKQLESKDNIQAYIKLLIERDITSGSK